MSTAAQPIQSFDPDSFHQQFTQAGGFDPDKFHEQYTGAPSPVTPSDSFIGPDNLAKAPFDVLTGAAKGLGNTIAGVSGLINKIPGIGETLAPKAGIGALHNMTRPDGLKQDVGYYGEQAGETMIPGLGEEGVGLKAAELAPKLGKVAAPLARTAYNALTMGTTNKLQGGDFGTGAAFGGAGSAVGEAGRAIAPSLAEGALGVTAKYRGHGKTPGEAALGEVHGINPGTIAENAQAKVSELVNQLETAAKASKVPASTQPALQTVLDEVNKAVTQNDKGYYDQVQKIWDQLTKDAFTGQGIPTNVSAEKILNLKRGIGNMIKSWPVEQQKGIQGFARKVYGALDAELDKAVPESASLNQRISSLIPVSQRAQITDASAGIGQRVAHRMAAHTGALAGAGIGGTLGYQKGGAPGAIAGGLTGLVAPEVLASPTAQMIGARMAASPTTARIGRGLASQLLHRKSEDENPE